MIVRLLLVACCLTTVAAAQHATVVPSATGIDIRLHEMHRAVRILPDGLARIALADSAADRSLDPSFPLDVLRWTVVLPSRSVPAIEVNVTSWRSVDHPAPPTVPPVAAFGVPGSQGGIPVVMLTVSPWKVEGGKVFIASEATISVRFAGRLLDAAGGIDIPSYMPPLANPGFVPAVRQKPAERNQQEVVPASWYDPARPYVKLSTTRDGIATVDARRITEIEPRLRSADIRSLILWHRGVAVPLEVSDADGNGILTEADTIWWFGRRPYGDSTWFSTWDTTSTFYLSTTSAPDPPRLAAWPPTSTTMVLDHLIMDRHVEYDTGYYHLGNADDADRGVFNADVAEGEGFYWMTLNATDYQRSRHAEVLTPLPSGTITTEVSYFTVNDPPIAIEHKFDVSVGGGSTVSLESGGYAAQSLRLDRTGAALGAGPVSVKFFATGIDSLRKYREYQSGAVVDYFTFRGPIAPFLHQGALDGFVKARSADARLTVSGLRTRSYAVLDVTNGRILRRTATQPTVLFRGGVTPVDIEWPTVAVNATLRRVSMMIDDAVQTWDSTTGFVGMARSAQGEMSAVRFETAASMAQWLRARPTGAAVIVAGTNVPADEALRAAIRDMGAQEPTSTSFMVAGIVGDAASALTTQTGSDPMRVGLVHRWNTTGGRLFADDIAIAADTLDVRLHIQDLASIEQAQVSLPTLTARSTSVVPQTDVVYVTHASHRANTERLAAHRRAWNGVTTMIVDIAEIIDEYGAGAHSPYAVRSFLLDVWERAPEPKPKYLVLVGNASWDVRLAVKGGNVGARRPDQVPTYGRPSADYWYGLLDDPDDIAHPELIVGRIPALTSDDSRNHIDKIIAHDTTSFAPWMRKFFFVGGGNESEGLCTIYENLLSDPFGTGYNLTGLPFCVDTATLCNYPTRPNLGYTIRQALNEGVEWLNFIGHGATDRFDILGWDPNELDNAGRGGFMATYACQTGAYSNPSTPCKNAQYLTEPSRGLVGAVGGTGWTWKVTVDNLHYRFHDAMRSEGLRAFGEIVYRGKTILASNGNQDGINTAMQQSLLGDPLSRVRIDTVTDAYVRRQDIQIVDRNGSTQLTEDDSLVVVRIRVRNAGVGTASPVVVRLRRTFDGVADSTETILEDGLCSEAMAICTLRVKDMVGDHAITINVDPDRILASDPRPNNVLQFALGIYTNALLPVEPQAHWTIQRRDVVVRMLDPNPSSRPTVAEFFISTARDTSDPALVVRSRPDDVRRDGSIIDWNIGVELPADADLWIGSRRREIGSTRTTDIDWLPVRTTSAPTTTTRTAAVSAKRHVPLDNSVVFDTATSSLRLLRRDVEIFMRSSGIQTADLLRQPIMQIHIGGIPWVNNPYFRGVNVVILGPLDTVPKAIRRYDTWQDPIPAELGPHNGYSHEFLQFMRDSVALGDRVLIALGDESLTGFQKDTTMDSLRMLMRSFGSAAVDSLRPQASWVFIGQRGLAPGMAIERWKNAPDSMVTLTVTLPYSAQRGSSTTPFIGPTKRWSFIDVDGISGDGSMTSYIIGRTSTGEQRIIDTLPEGVGRWTPDDGAAEYPFLAVVSDMRFIPSDSIPAVRGLAAEFIPADEWLIERGDVSLSQNDVLRGDTVIATYHVRNAYRTLASDPVDGSVRAFANGSTERPVSIPWVIPTPLEPDATVELVARVPTARLGSSSTVEVTVNDAGRRALYAFNDLASTSLRIGEDSTRPTIEAKVDGKGATDGMYALRESEMTIVLQDASKLPIGDSTRLTVFINGDRIKASNTTGFMFVPTERITEISLDADARAGMRFRYPLELGQNNVIVRGFDATGNGDTLEFRVFTTDRTELRDVTVAPNPVSNAAVMLVDLVTDKPTVIGRIEIYGVEGVRMRSMLAELALGRTSVAWDGRDDTGALVPTGVYHARFVADDPAGPSSRITQFVVMR